MNSKKLWQTATPSYFGMPISGRALGATTAATDVRTSTAAVVRERAAIAATQGAVEGHVAFAPSEFPGTTAWRPPTC